MTQQLALDLHLRDDFSFDSYLPASNQQLVLALQTLHSEYPLYFWGEAGSGKTHLIHALLNQQTQQTKTVTLLPLRDSASLDSQVCSGLEQCELICIDDIDGIAADRHWQQALFHLLNRAKECGSSVVVSAHCAPQHLAVFADLQSRLAASLIFEQLPLRDSDKALALQQRAQMRGLQLGDEVTQFLITRAPRDAHSLFGLLDKLDKHSMVKQRRLTVPLVKEVLFAAE